MDPHLNARFRAGGRKGLGHTEGSFRPLSCCVNATPTRLWRPGTLLTAACDSCYAALTRSTARASRSHHMETHGKETGSRAESPARSWRPDESRRSVVPQVLTPPPACPTLRAVGAVPVFGRSYRTRMGSGHVQGRRGQARAGIQLPMPLSPLLDHRYRKPIVAGGREGAYGRGGGGGRLFCGQELAQGDICLYYTQ